jgi:predicted GIY-YIG superfamily endonuclease
MTRNEDTAKEFQNQMNSLNASIKFELELPSNDNTLKLIDFQFSLENDQQPKFQFYKKAAKKDIFVNYHSTLPKSQKANIIENEKKRIKERCSDPVVKRAKLLEFENILRLNDYPVTFITKSRNNNHRHQSNVVSTTNSYFYINIPFINDRLNWKLKRIFKEEDINVRFFHHNKSLRNILQRPQSIETCQKNNCHWINSGLCLRKNIVYMITCLKCSKRYIGSTIRALHLRLHEHLHDVNSAVFNHIHECQLPMAEINRHLLIKILTKEKESINLRIKEALLIKELHPELNTRNELNELRMLM